VFSQEKQEGIFFPACGNGLAAWILWILGGTQKKTPAGYAGVLDLCF
jgi:hypothetical protein